MSQIVIPMSEIVIDSRKSGAIIHSTIVLSCRSCLPFLGQGAGRSPVRVGDADSKLALFHTAGFQYVA